MSAGYRTQTESYEGVFSVDNDIVVQPLILNSNTFKVHFLIFILIHFQVTLPRGGVHLFRMSLWREHFGSTGEFISPGNASVYLDPGALRTSRIIRKQSYWVLRVIRVLCCWVFRVIRGLFYWVFRVIRGLCYWVFRVIRGLCYGVLGFQGFMLRGFQGFRGLCYWVFRVLELLFLIFYKTLFLDMPKRISLLTSAPLIKNYLTGMHVFILIGLHFLCLQFFQEFLVMEI